MTHPCMVPIRDPPGCQACGMCCDPSLRIHAPNPATIAVAVEDDAPPEWLPFAVKLPAPEKGGRWEQGEWILFEITRTITFGTKILPKCPYLEAVGGQFRCAIYPTRPRICWEFQEGTDPCNRTRQMEV